MRSALKCRSAVICFLAVGEGGDQEGGFVREKRRLYMKALALSEKNEGPRHVLHGRRPELAGVLPIVTPFLLQSRLCPESVSISSPGTCAVVLLLQPFQMLVGDSEKLIRYKQIW